MSHRKLPSNVSSRKGRLRLAVKSHLPAPLEDESQKHAGGIPYASIVKGEFPSLSGTSQQLGSSNPSAMWSTSGATRGLSSAAQRLPLSSRETQAEDFFASSRMSSAQGSFRFGSQASTTPSAGQGQAGAADEFPPLNRNANGEIGSLAYGSPAPSAIQNTRPGNGLLNALSQNNRASENRTPSSIARPQDPRSPAMEDDSRGKHSGYREDSLATHSSIGDGQGSALANRNPHGAIGNDPPTGKQKEEDKGRASDVPDPLEGMAPADKWGLKGLRTLMNNYPDYNALAHGVDLSNLGLNLGSDETIADKMYSLFDSEPPRPVVPKFQIPDCYRVGNVQPIEHKIQSFNEETLMWIFYSCPGDRKQILAASELMGRNWRWHKKLQIWLTKDDMMHPQVLDRGIERGYYVVWDTSVWHKERRELTLHHADLAGNPNSPQLPGPVA